MTTNAEGETDHDNRGRKREVAALGGRMPLPASPLLRVSLGFLLVLGGALGFLPVLGFWMIPLGLAVLAIDIPAAARLHAGLIRWIERRRRRGGALWRLGPLRRWRNRG